MSLGTSNAWPQVDVLNIFTTLKKLSIKYWMKFSFFQTISFTHTANFSFLKSIFCYTLLPVLRHSTAPFEEMLWHWRAVGNAVSDLTGPRFQP